LAWSADGSSQIQIELALGQLTRGSECSYHSVSNHYTLSFVPGPRVFAAVITKTEDPALIGTKPTPTKTERELAEGKPVAEAINQSDGTDFLEIERPNRF
jgi:hypothetical protein